MTKEKYLQKISFTRSEVHLLITCTRAGAIRVHLEEVHEKLLALYKEVDFMSEEKFKQWVAA